MPLPVTATNILVEYHAVNLGKPVDFNGRNKVTAAKYFAGAPAGDSAPSKAGDDTAVEGLDPVLSLLPKEVTSKLSLATLA